MIRIVRVPGWWSGPDRLSGNTSLATWGYTAVAVFKGEVIGSAPGVTPAAALAGLSGDVVGVADSVPEDRSLDRRLAICLGGEIEGSVMVRLEGTALQLEVWEALMAIPHGSTSTYSELAAAIDRPRAVRAVASACAANRIGILVPCHRVIRSDGSIGGYRWGEALKRRILETERASGPDSIQAGGDVAVLRAA